MSHQIMKEVKWEAGHRLLNYSGECSNIHGHSYRANIHLESASLDKCGFVKDFGDIKEKIKPWIDDHWDHAMLVNRDDHAMRKFLFVNKQREYVFEENPTAENIAKILYEVCSEFLNTKEVRVSHVTIFETATSSATYQASFF